MTRLATLQLLMFAMIALSPGVQAQNRLFTLSADDEQKDYYVILRRVFHRIYEDDFVLSALSAVGTGHKEVACGVLRNGDGYEAVSVFPSASVWGTELPFFLRGLQEECFDDATGKKIPCPPRTRTQGAPRSYRGITTVIRRRPLPADLADRLKRVWRQKVQEARRVGPLADDERGISSLSEYYSVRSDGEGWMTALATCYDTPSDASRMSDLAVALQGYAVGAVSERDLRRALSAVEAQKT